MEDEHLWVTAPENSLDIDKYRGYIIPEFIRKNIDRWGWGDFIVFESAENGRKYTRNEVLKNSQTFAAGLIKMSKEINLQRHEVVAMILPNVPEYGAILFGIWEAGFVATTINPAYTRNEINGQIELSGTKVIVTCSKLLPVARSIQQASKMILKIIVVGDDPHENYEDCLNYFEMLETDTNEVDFFSGSQLTSENDLALLSFSSGTSGLPKAVALTHFALLSNTIIGEYVHTINITKHGKGNKYERMIAILPFFHVYGFNAFISVVMLQGTHVLTMETFNPALFIQKLRQFKPTVLIIVPTLLAFVSTNDNIGEAELESVWLTICGAASCRESLVKMYLRKATNTMFTDGYGLSETAVVSVARFQRIGSIGQPLPEVIVKIVDSITGLTLGPGERGELCVKSPSIMKCYLNNEQATKDAIDEDGWFHTGDIGYYDDEGCLFIVDRLKELIKVKGFQVAPSELEDLIRSHEKVADVGVIGIPDERFGEVPRAFVVPKSGENLTETEIKDFVKGKVADYKSLRGGVQFVQDIPKSTTGKILRRILKDKYQ